MICWNSGICNLSDLTLMREVNKFGIVLGLSKEVVGMNLLDVIGFNLRFMWFIFSLKLVCRRWDSEILHLELFELEWWGDKVLSNSLCLEFNRSKVSLCLDLIRVLLGGLSLDKT